MKITLVKKAQVPGLKGKCKKCKVGDVVDNTPANVGGLCEKCKGVPAVPPQVGTSKVAGSKMCIKLGGMVKKSQSKGKCKNCGSGDVLDDNSATNPRFFCEQCKKVRDEDIKVGGTGSRSVRLSKSQWSMIGVRAGWLKQAQTDKNAPKDSSDVPFYTGFDSILNFEGLEDSVGKVVKDVEKNKDIDKGKPKGVDANSPAEVENANEEIKDLVDKGKDIGVEKMPDKNLKR